jgi:protein-L-isoaspartate(D-aspartate) O-methyltransferase
VSLSADSLRAEMVAGLIERGELSSDWRAAFEEVPRHWFIPDRVWRHAPNAGGAPDLVPVDRAEDPTGWLAMSYAPDSVITQVDDGRPDANGRGHEPSSSASMPAVVATMLAALDAQPGMRALEIGTGTGWNAALLASRLRASAVTSVETDPAVTRHARQRLAEHGFQDITTVVCDGAEGWPDGAPYDRVLATVAAPLVPYAWIEQTRPGGVVLLPWGTAFYPGGLLRVAVSGTTGHGRVVGEASFMRLRAQRSPRIRIADIRDPDATVTESTTDVHPWYLRGDVDAAVAIGLHVPAIESYYGDDGVFRLLDRHSRSWATVEIDNEPPYAVEQAGPRKIYDEVIAAYAWWRGTGRPAAGDWQVTIDPRGQHVELIPTG